MRFAMAVVFLCMGTLCAFRGEPGLALRWCEQALPAVRGAIAAVSARFSFPVAEAGLIGLAILILRSSARRKRLAAVGVSLLLALTFLWFPLCMVQAVPDPTAQLDACDLIPLCERLALEAADLQRGLPEDTHGRVLLPYTQRDLLREAARLCGSEILPKASRLPGLMTALGVSGVWSPMTSEAIVDCTLPAAALPFTLCHELAHSAGVAGEAAANLYAWEACRRGDPAFRYSGAVSALWYALNVLRHEDEQTWAEMVDRMDRAVLRDFSAMNGLSTAEASILQRAQDVLTDLYLRLTGAGDYAAFLASLA